MRGVGWEDTCVGHIFVRSLASRLCPHYLQAPCISDTHTVFLHCVSMYVLSPHQPCETLQLLGVDPRRASVRRAPLQAQAPPHQHQRQGRGRVPRPGVLCVNMTVAHLTYEGGEVATSPFIVANLFITSGNMRGTMYILVCACLISCSPPPLLPSLER